MSIQFDLFGGGEPPKAAPSIGAMTRRPRLLESLARICAELPVDEKVLVAPSRFVGHEIAEALVRSGTRWVNLHVESVGSLAHGVIGPALAREGKVLLSRAQALALVEQACAEALGPGSYFGELTSRPGLHRAIQSTFHELRSVGIAPNAIPEEAFGDARKAADVRAVLARYESALEKGGYVDRADVLRRAVSVLRAKMPAPGPLYLVASPGELLGVEEELVELLAAGRKRVLENDPLESWIATARGAKLFRALGEENEIREVFRRILAGGVRFDDVEILTTDSATYGPLVHELAAEHDIPCTFADGVAATFTRPGQAVLGYLRWLEKDFESEELRAILAAGLIDLFHIVPSREPPGSLPAARELKDARIGWGRERTLRSLDAHVTELEAELEIAGRRTEDAEEDRSSRVAWLEKRLDTSRFVRTFVAQLIAATPGAPPAGDSKVELAEVARAASEFVTSFGRSSGELDGIAAKALRDLFGDLETLPFPRLTLSASANRLAEAVVGLHVSPDRPRSGRLHVADYRSGGYGGRSHTFLVGLDARRHPGAGLQDPILLDPERRAINSALSPLELSLRARRPAENALALQSVLARLRGNVTVSYASWDLLEAREQFPAAAFLEIYRVASGSVAADYGDLEAALADRAGFLTDPERALDETEWWLAQTSEDRGRAAASVREAYPWLIDGHEAVTHRETERFTVYDGLIRKPDGLDPRTSGRPTSASRLQDLARCPYSYLLKRVLKVQPPEDARRDPTVWLDAREIGLLLHEVFHRFYVEADPDAGKPVVARDSARIQEIASEEIEKWKARVPPRSVAALEAVTEDVRIACRNFLQDEEQYCRTVTPRWFEVGFGASKDAIEPPGSAEPVRIPLESGTSFLLSGRIDRVDEVGQDEYQIWDYKTGSSWATANPTRALGGRRIQDVLYAKALEVLLAREGRPGHVVQSGYFYPGKRGEGERYQGNVDFAATIPTLEALLDLLKGGAFPHSKKKDDCSLCDFQKVCGGADAGATRTLNKLGVPGSNTELDPYRILNP